MKKSNLVMFIVGAALVGSALGAVSYVSEVQAAPAAKVEFESPQTILRCETETGRTLQVRLANGHDFILDYGVKLDTPTYSVVKKTEDMAWSREYNSVQKVDNVEIYYTNGDENGKISITDTGKAVDVEFTMDINQAVGLHDTCKTIARLSVGDELFKDMFYVDNE